MKLVFVDMMHVRKLGLLNGLELAKKQSTRWTIDTVIIREYFITNPPEAVIALDDTELFFQAAKEQDTGLQDLLLYRGNIDFNACDVGGNTLLHYAVRDGRVRCLTKVLATPVVDCNRANRLGQTVLHLLLGHGFTERRVDKFLDILLTRDDLDVNARDIDGKTPLAYLAEEVGRSQCCHPAIAKLSSRGAGLAGIELRSISRRCKWCEAQEVGTQYPSAAQVAITPDWHEDEEDKIYPFPPNTQRISQRSSDTDSDIGPCTPPESEAELALQATIVDDVTDAASVF